MLIPPWTWKLPARLATATDAERYERCEGELAAQRDERLREERLLDLSRTQGAPSDRAAVVVTMQRLFALKRNQRYDDKDMAVECTLALSSRRLPADGPGKAADYLIKAVGEKKAVRFAADLFAWVSCVNKDCIGWAPVNWEGCRCLPPAAQTIALSALFALGIGSPREADFMANEVPKNLPTYDREIFEIRAAYMLRGPSAPGDVLFNPGNIRIQRLLRVIKHRASLLGMISAKPKTTKE